MSRHHNLGLVSVENSETAIEIRHASDFLTLYDYSQFKYGNGVVADAYGRAMAEQFISEQVDVLDEPEVLVTSSAFKVAPPASAALMEPFVTRATELAATHGSDTKFTPFKINRANLTNGDYASMSAAERETVMKKNGLSLPDDVDLSGKLVVALDDIYVTGSHEKALDNALRPAEPRNINYSYIFRVICGHNDPKIESVINSSAVKTVHDVIPLTESQKFRPNARLCKFILTQSVDDILLFCAKVHPSISNTIWRNSIGDGLPCLLAYRAGAEIMSNALTAH